MDTQHPYDVQYITASAVKIALGLQAHLYTGNLSDVPDWDFAGDHPGPLQQQNHQALLNITTRDFIRTVFAILGIEIEFSGKSHHEKGVIIDIDEDRINGLGLNTETLKFGQTIVKVDLNYTKVPEPDHVYNALKMQLKESSSIPDNLEKLISEMLYSHIKEVKKAGF